MSAIAQALSAVMADVRGVRKGDVNEQQGFNFRGIDSVVNAVGPAFRKHGVVVVPELRDIKTGTVEVGYGDRRRPIAHVVVTVAYTFVGADGSTLTAVTPGEAMDSGDKAISKAMSVAFRVALLQALCIPTDEPDPDAAVYERAPVEEPPPEKRASRTRAQKPAEQLGGVNEARHLEKYQAAIAAASNHAELRSAGEDIAGDNALSQASRLSLRQQYDARWKELEPEGAP